MILRHVPKPSQTEWHRVFAWWPVEITDWRLVWLEYVYRKYGWQGSSGHLYNPSYKLPEKLSKED
jgi:hypothetical protein